MTTKRLLLVLSLALALLYVAAPKLSAQALVESADDSVQMVINYGQGKEKRRHSHQDTVEPVGLAIGQQVEITLEFSKEKPGQSVVVTPLDGGRITAPEGPLTVAADGTARFSFQAGQTPGLYRLLVRGAQPYELQLYAVDPNRPGPPERVPGGP